VFLGDVPIDPEPLRSLLPFFRPKAQLFFKAARDFML